MPQVPAVCDSCGRWFASGFRVENGKHVNFSHNEVGPCPHCGAMGHVPDALFNVLENSIEFLAGPDRSLQELKRLQDILTAIRSAPTDPAEVRETLRRKAPELQGLADVLPQTRSELYAFVAVLLVIISMAIAQMDRGEKVNINVENVIQVIIEQFPPPIEALD